MTSPRIVDADIASLAALIADPARAAMIGALYDGRPLAAGELAKLAGVSPQTASSHLRRLIDGGMLRVHEQGRYRYYALAGSHVADAIEAFSAIAPLPPVRSLRQSQEARRLATARTCYKHLGGALSVRILDALVRDGCCERYDDGIAVTPKGIEFFAQHGIRALGFSRCCIDWTERRQHIGGKLGQALFERMMTGGWIERGQVRRSIVVTEFGKTQLDRYFDEH